MDESYRDRPLSTWTDGQLAQRVQELRAEMCRDWCVALIWQEIDLVEQERTKPERLAMLAASADPSLIPIQVLIDRYIKPAMER